MQAIYIIITVRLGPRIGGERAHFVVLRTFVRIRTRVLGPTGVKKNIYILCKLFCSAGFVRTVVLYSIYLRWYRVSRRDLAISPAVSIETLEFCQVFIKLSQGQKHLLPFLRWIIKLKKKK